ncbi:MAG: iron ABC transporter permease [Deltaproteobacteria bacterium]|nr:iron ABC transporter permease [Deltaproteobacteria bacterium]
MKDSSVATGAASPLDLATVRSQRRAGTRCFVAAVLVLSLGLLISVALATGIGRMDIGWLTVAQVILGKLGFSIPALDRTTEVVIWGIRLSRVVLAGLVGASLATAGAVFQGLLLNPLADPFTLGVSTGAAFGVALLVMLGVGGSYLGLSPLPLAALVGALGAMAAVLVLSREKGSLRKESLILAGIVVSTFLSALISLVKSLDEESLSAIVFWIMGSFSGRGWIHVGFLIPYAVLGLILAGAHHRELDILALGEEQSHHLGVSVSKVRLKLLLGASLLTAGAVAVSGVIGFVGLVVPHLVRILAGPSHGRLLALSAFTGALILIWADVVARVLLANGQELPVGVVTALFGGPFFFYLLKSRRSRGMW